MLSQRVTTDPPESSVLPKRFDSAPCNAGRRYALLLAVSCALVFLSIGTACGGEQQKEFRIGLIAPITGNIPTVGESTVNAANLVVDQINGAGGLEVAGEKYEVVLLVEDNEDKADVSASKVRALIGNLEAAAIVGPQASRNAIPASIVAERARIPMISPSSTNPETTLNKGWVFRAAFIDPFQGQVLARFVREQLNAKTVAVIFDVGSIYNRDLADVFTSSFEGLGGDLVAFESYTADAPDITQQLSRVKDSQAEVLFLPNYDQEVPEQCWVSAVLDSSGSERLG